MKKLIFGHLLLKPRQSQSGYILVATMVLTGFVMSIALLAILRSDTSKSTARTFLDENNAFYGAEAKLNERIANLKSVIKTGKEPTGTGAAIANCTDTTKQGSGDLGCKSYALSSTSADGVSRSGDTYTNKSTQENYIGYTAVTDLSVKDANGQIAFSSIPSGDRFEGVNAKEYNYRIDASVANSNGTNNAKTRLNISQRMRKIPVFQFRTFAFGDRTEIAQNSGTTGSVLNVGDRNHVNGNLYLAVDNAADSNKTVFSGKWTIGGKLYSGSNPYNDMFGKPTYANSYVKLNGQFATLPDPALQMGSALVYSQLAKYSGIIETQDTGMTPLILPDREFMRAKNVKGEVQELYGKADLRINFQYRDGGVNFQVTSIQTGAGATGSDTCNDIDPKREDYATVKCRNLTKGQTNSLRQPTLLSAKDNSTESSKFCPTLPALKAGTGLSIAQKDAVIFATQLAVSGSNSPLILDDMAMPPVGDLKTNLQSLYNKIPGLKKADVTSLLNNSPAETVALRKGCFLVPAISPKRYKNMEYFWRLPLARKHCYVAMMEINLQSLAAWNRDGVYVEFPDQNFKTEVTTIGPKQDPDFVEDMPGLTYIGASKITPAALLNAQNKPANALTSGMAYVRAAADSTSSNQLIASGLGAADRTDGGLIVHGRTDYPDITVDPTTKVITDPFYKSVKTGLPLAGESYLEFIVFGGKNLPAPMSFVAAERVSIQGDYNLDRQPAAIAAEIVTYLSNNCLSTPGNQQVKVYENFNVFMPLGATNCSNHDTRSPGHEEMLQKPNVLPIATDTTINAAVAVSNQDISEGWGDPYPIQFTENWEGKTLNSYTAQTIVGKPLLDTDYWYVPPITGASQTNEVFRPPTLNVRYEPKFDDYQLLPPGTPMATQILTNEFQKK
jgi:Tfp pilus assembly protein PilX